MVAQAISSRQPASFLTFPRGGKGFLVVLLAHALCLNLGPNLALAVVEATAIFVSRLSLTNFRNYAGLDLHLPPGMVLVQGDNGQGKTSLLEAIYMLAVAKSPRASSDRALVRRQPGEEETYARIAAVVNRDGDDLRIQIDFRAVVPLSDEGDTDQEIEALTAQGVSVQKYVRVDGIPRRAADLVGHVNAVMFSAEDMELVYGPPVGRRRYLDILISQHDQAYLKSLQRYHRIVSQRNHLLRTIREGGARLEELEFWDEQLVAEGVQVMARRSRTVEALMDIAGPVLSDLTGGSDRLRVVYRPNTGPALADSPHGPDQPNPEQALGEQLTQGLTSNRRREVAQGVTVTGPHRDDLLITINGLDAGAYASRGQCRTAVLAMRLAEAAYLAKRSGRMPILLLDDVLSELDADRRARVLDTVRQYEQCLITTTDADSIEASRLSSMARFRVDARAIEAL